MKKDGGNWIRYKLLQEGKLHKELKDYLGIHSNSLYKKLNGKIPFKETEKMKINEYLNFTKTDINKTWKEK